MRIPRSVEAGFRRLMRASISEPSRPIPSRIPRIPGIPGIPSIPGIPGIPGIPSIPRISGIPGIPGIPGIFGARAGRRDGMESPAIPRVERGGGGPACADTAEASIALAKSALLSAETAGRNERLCSIREVLGLTACRTDCGSLLVSVRASTGLTAYSGEG